jgi:NhaA family Na+:H+ antiporter
VKSPPAEGLLPARPIQVLVRPLERFLQIESANGVLLLVCTLVALALANSPWAAAYHQFWHTHASISVGDWKLDHSLAHWVNDGLMTIFFFVVGLEIKRELVLGELRDPRQAALPIVAAIGGMLVPAAIFYLLQRGTPGERGWGIPMATDIAFVVGLLALLGKRVPIGLKILLLALAIADDIGAVLVIAVFYTEGISGMSLAWAGGGFVLVLAMQFLGVRQVRWYALVGVAIWFAFLLSGVHPTVAGVILGLLTPSRAWVPSTLLQRVLDRSREELDEKAVAPHRLQELRVAAREAASPLERLEHGLHPWVAFGIMPIFALANAGVTLDARQLASPIALAVAAGLLIGKPLGVVLASIIAVRLGWAKLPPGVNWQAMLGGGFLAGIGFTMSLFVAGLALSGEALEAGKFGTLAGSALCALIGSALLLWFLPRYRLNDDLNPAEPLALERSPV